MTVFNGISLIKRLLGTGMMGRNYLMSIGYEIQYPHNSFIELLFYSGYLGIAAIILFEFANIVSIFKNDKMNGKIILAIKIITIIEGLSVTMSGYGYWTFWLFV